MSPAVYQTGEVGQLSGLQEGAKDLPVDSVPADYQNSFGHVEEVNSAAVRIAAADPSMRRGCRRAAGKLGALLFQFAPQFRCDASQSG